MPRQPVKVLLVEDEDIVREGLRHLLDSVQHLTVCDAVASAAEAEGSMAREWPDLVVSDLVLDDGSDAVQLTKAIKARSPRLPVLVLSGYDEGLHAEQTLAAGASGFVMKSAPVETLLEAIDVALDGGIWVSRAVAQELVEEQAMVDVQAELDAAIDPSLLRELRSGNRSVVGLGRALGWSTVDVETALALACRRLALTNPVALYLAATWLQHRPSEVDAQDVT